MLSQRTRLSLCQFLALQEPTVCTVLLGKAGIFSDLYPALLLRGLTDTLTRADQNAMMVLLDEIVRTQGNLRSAVSPRYRFEERWIDLVQCLVLDGYVVEDREIRASDPSIGDAAPVDDDLLRELGSCAASRASEIIRKINESTEMFRVTPPNYNASLNAARVALETLAVDIAESLKALKDQNYNPAKWGGVISYLKTAGLISMEEEKGLAGVYGFISPGSHRPVGVSEEQMARLGRSLALGMCWFLLKRKLGSGL
ncbi:hypothetical protein [Paraburkholderia phenazinium]|uniref:Uncharacterized protein n=1 Tax=Paraburkholderia phenazinium TaxID=60549 RepID=A0A1N6I6T1_9BURK|nr:hypothetical protein [Paraburkholderia phenazinium]SIO27711.1 hypothetical protein SAMN05444165_1864 [Paraburkholderia phenazinium]